MLCNQFFNNEHKRYVNELDTKRIFKLREACNKELYDRVNARLQATHDLKEGWHKFANFMAGIAQAMACRSVLRWSAGHSPYGVRPASGECWTPKEIHYAYMLADRVANERNLSIYANPLYNRTYIGYVGQQKFELLWLDVPSPAAIVNTELDSFEIPF